MSQDGLAKLLKESSHEKALEARFAFAEKVKYDADSSSPFD